MHKKQFLSPADVAQELDISSTTVLRMIHSGELPAILVSDRIYRIPGASFAMYKAGTLHAAHGGQGSGSGRENFCRTLAATLSRAPVDDDAVRTARTPRHARRDPLELRSNLRSSDARQVRLRRGRVLVQRRSPWLRNVEARRHQAGRDLGTRTSR